MSLRTPVKRTLGLAGLTNFNAARGREDGAWEDCDKAMARPDGSLDSWSGYQRVASLLDSGAMGAAGSRFDIVRFSQDYLRRHFGHGLALIDRNANTAGRIIALAHAEGVLGTQVIGKVAAVSVDGGSPAAPTVNWNSGLFTGSAPAVYEIEIDGESTPDTFKWSNDRGGTYEATTVAITGSAQTLESGIQITFPATTGYTSGDKWRFAVGGWPSLAGSVQRIYPHQYIPILGAGGKNLILNPLGDVYVDDGYDVRTRPSDPRVKPVITFYRTAAGSDIGDTDQSTDTWTAGSATVVEADGTEVTPNITVPDSATNMVLLTIPDSVRRGGVNLAYTDNTISIAATVKSLRLKIWVDSPRGWIDRKVFSLVLATGTGLGGTTEEVVINQRIKSRTWETIDLPWTAGTFSMASVGLKLRRSLFRRHFTSSNLKVFLASITQDAGSSGGAGQTQDSGVLKDEGEWYGRFNWRIRKTGWRSQLSPIFGPFKGNAARWQWDLSGEYEDIPTGMANSIPDGVDAFDLWVANDAWGPDPRFSGTTGAFGLSFFRFTDIDGESTDKLTVSGNKLLYDMGDEAEEGALNSVVNERDAFYNAAPRGGLVGVVDGQRIVTAGTPSLRVGTWSVTAGLHIAEPDSDAASVAGAWMEGRLFLVDGDLDAYRVAKWIEPNGTYANGAIFIFKDFDPVTQDYATPYQGATNASAPGIVLGDARRIYWTSQTEYGGTEIEQMSVLNQLEVMPVGDQIVAAFKVGIFLNVMGSSNAFALQQNVAALDDLPLDSGPAYSAPQHIVAPGAIGPRMVDVYEGRAYLISPRGELWVGNGQAFEKHPASASLQSFLLGKGLISDTRSLHDSWMRVFPSEAGLMLYIAAISGTPANPIGFEYRGPGVYRTDGSLGGEDAYQHPGGIGLRWPFVAGDASVAGEGVLYDGGILNWSGDEVPGSADTSFSVNAVSDGEGEPGVLIYSYPGNGYSGAEQAVPTGLSLKDSYIFLMRAGSSWVDPDLLWRKVTAHDTGAKTVTIESAWGVTQGSAMQGLFAGPKDFVFAAFDKTFAPVADASGAVDIVTFRIKTGAVHTPSDGLVGQDSISGESNYYAGWTVICCDGRRIDLGGGETYKGAGGIVQTYDASTGEIVMKTGYLMPQSLWVGDDPAVSYEWDDMTDPPSFCVLIAPGPQTVIDTSGNLSEPEPEALAYVSSRDCAAPAVSLDTAALSNDFEVGVLVNLDLGLVTLASQCPWTTPGMTPSGSCTAPGQAPQGIFFGDKHGFLDFVFEQQIMGWGSPLGRVLYQADPDAPGSATTFKVRILQGGAATYGLPVDAYGTGLLADIVVKKFTPSTKLEEYRTVASNTADTGTINGQWDTTPTSADYFLIAPLEPYVRFAQARSNFPRLSKALSLRADIDEGRGHDEAAIDVANIVRVEQFAPTGKRDFVNAESLPVATDVFDLEDHFSGDQMFHLTPVSGKAIAYGVRWTQPQYGPIRLHGIMAHELASRLEPRE